MGQEKKSTGGATKSIVNAVSAWLQIGTADLPNRQKQRIVLTNVMVSSTALLSYIHAAFFILYDFEQLYFPTSYLVIIATALLAAPYLNIKNPYLGSIYNLTLWLVFGCMNVVTFGTESNVQFYFLAGAASAILILGVYQNLLSILSIIIQISIFVYFDITIIPPASYLDLPIWFYTVLNIAAILLSMTFIFCMVYYAFYQVHIAEDALEREYKYSEDLLANMLPAVIASKLKRDPNKTIADNHSEVTILFADIVGFTKRAEHHNPKELVSFLNTVFTEFDTLVRKHQLEKIKTIGDAIMVAGGMPNKQDDHAKRIALLALDMMEVVKHSANASSEVIELRIGIHTGPAVAGVIGSQKPFYDVWGDTVNTAAHLETYGTQGEIHISSATKDHLDDQFLLKSRGHVELKSKSSLETWHLLGKS
ncbi:adenylate/guanylate cyclase domain-containing protein [Amylibacter sp. SFDW26]|uniref:adenylate/guanylate cyclase domain-containing protein n=1 Tax=Amylibacter sp. SFDW26 TaxID=2652722 RepID=UPI001261E23E|nr:adenylate/guanylate cyclase domain-containing protein [Amylibacter sp. SFDW26]KAB7610462.1 adenylate/guanylate cyclase domain-containing protein [Amylibacter sp. SFDW26]